MTQSISKKIFARGAAQLVLVCGLTVFSIFSLLALTTASEQLVAANHAADLVRDFDTNLVRAGSETGTYLLTGEAEHRAEADELLGEAEQSLAEMTALGATGELAERAALVGDLRAGLAAITPALLAGDLAARVPLIERTHAALERLDPLEERIDADRDTTAVAIQATIRQASRRIIFAVAGIIIIALVVLAGDSFFTIKNIIRPISGLISAANAVAGGDLSQQVVPSTDDEIGTLQRRFNDMVGRLAEQRRALEQQANELRAARAGAEESSRAKSEFLANMSHELRTPLNAVIGYSELIQEDAADLGQPDFAESAGRIRAAGHHLLALINDILDISKIEAGKMDIHIETINLPELVRDVATTIRPQAEKRGNRLEVSLAEGVGEFQTDQIKVRQALLNLLSNAVKFTERGAVRLRVEPAARDGRDWLAFRVEDTGIGISPAQMSRLFQAFTQADSSTTRKYGGTGLGLVLSRRFCQMLGGDITVHSAPGEGSTFTMYLPLEATGQGQIPGAEPGGEQPVVLLIDDDPATQNLLTRGLARQGLEVRIAGDGAAGLAMARAARPAAIVLDVLLPDTDGWALLAALKSDPELMSIPVIMQTIIEDSKQGYALGAADYLVKPIDRARLLDALRRCLAPAPTGAPVLIVEDDQPTRALLRQLLEREGLAVSEAPDGRVALDSLARQTPALMLLDLMMPEVDGFEVLEALRANPAWAAIPVIVLTARELSEQERRGLAQSVQRIIQKGGGGNQELLEQVAALVRGQAPRTSEGAL
ncbi:MAG TPA: response regulator [Herpetosiphonaceae bacterium]